MKSMETQVYFIKYAGMLDNNASDIRLITPLARQMDNKEQI